MKNLIARLWSDEEGQDLTEYALILVLIALTTIAAMGKLTNSIKTTFSTAAGNLHVS